MEDHPPRLQNELFAELFLQLLDERVAPERLTDIFRPGIGDDPPQLHANIVAGKIQEPCPALAEIFEHIPLNLLARHLTECLADLEIVPESKKITLLVDV